MPSISGHNKMGLVISTSTCSLCRDFVHWRNLSARQPGRMGFLGGRHYGRGTESSLARVNNGKVDNLDDPTGMVLFGWEDVKHHLVCVERPVELKNRIRSGFEVGGGTPGKSTPAKSSNEGGVEGIIFNTRASELMLIVLGKLGLDPARTTADDLDGLGKGFLCYELLGMSPGLMLKQKDNSGVVNTKVLEWRDFVVHILRHRQRNGFPFSVLIEKLLVEVVSMDSK
ncbi:hypothetical protein BDN72DRAFT_434716 [Pluteus cervinus]|uniref:Uncharacterized protein n=1 Tax=Pluteus cervinus TaxID=181527 RepID=A0ACD3A8F8_9AGAR|nr:hypothetical protein BDN72DRAFT_434716 [Pluteus cervinus]